MIRGEIWWGDFGIPFGSEPGRKRPSIIVQSDAFNKTEMHTTIVIPLTMNLHLADFPGNVLLTAEETGLPRDSVAVTPQITVIDRARLAESVSVLPDYIMRQCADGIKLILDIESNRGNSESKVMNNPAEHTAPCTTPKLLSLLVCAVFALATFCRVRVAALLKPYSLTE